MDRKLETYCFSLKEPCIAAGSLINEYNYCCLAHHSGVKAASVLFDRKFTA